ncbi:MAG: trehalase-like domain-containing protein, partial [Rhodanobacteraceae bacterium]
MGQRIEDYALIGNMRTAALVGRDGSIDWLCLPRFDSAACCAALVGSPDNGHWQIAPVAKPKGVQRSYRGDTMVLETLFRTEAGEVALIDFLAMPRDDSGTIELVRIVEGRGGSVPMRMQALFRFDYGRIVPWSGRRDDAIQFIAGPHALELISPLALDAEGDAWQGEFTATKGSRTAFVLRWQDAWCKHSGPVDVEAALQRTVNHWRDWSARYPNSHPWRQPVVRSLLTLKVLSDRRTGGIVGAPSMGLPEVLGGSKNYDYRYTWLRDATFTLYALLH